MSILKRLADKTGLTETLDQMKTDSNVASWDDLRARLTATPPPRDAPVEELLDYIEKTATITTGGKIRSRNLVNPLVALCQANLDTHPEIVHDLVHRILEADWDLHYRQG